MEVSLIFRSKKKKDSQENGPFLCGVSYQIESILKCVFSYYKQGKDVVYEGYV